MQFSLAREQGSWEFTASLSDFLPAPCQHLQVSPRVRGPAARQQRGGWGEALAEGAPEKKEGKEESTCC